VKKEQLIATLAAAASDSDPLVREVVFYTGANVPRFDFWTGEEYMLRFSMEPKDVNLSRLKAGAPLLDSHNSYRLENQLGVVEDAWLDGNRAMARVRFSAREDVADVVRDVNDGIIRNLSMGVEIGKREDITEKGSKMRQYLARDWQPMEISIVPIGADAGAQFLSTCPEYQVMRSLMERHNLSADPGAAGEADRARYLIQLQRVRHEAGL
jgi:hypothetical protein